MKREKIMSIKITHTLDGLKRRKKNRGGEPGVGSDRLNVGRSQPDADRAQAYRPSSDFI